MERNTILGKTFFWPHDSCFNTDVAFYRTRCVYRKEVLTKGARVQGTSAPQTFPIQYNASEIDALSDPNLTDKEMLEVGQYY